jgi:hypothetical protein
VTLSLFIRPRVKSIDTLFVLIDRDTATGAAAGADRRLTFQPPDALLIQEVFTAKSTHGAQVNDISGQRIVDRMSGENIDLFV